jgi:hypothetical protein
VDDSTSRIENESSFTEGHGVEETGLPLLSRLWGLERLREIVDEGTSTPTDFAQSCSTLD